jgi:hypothetical protein
MEVKSPNYWMAVGSVENWNEAFRLGNIWGLEPKRQTLWESVEVNDVLLFYAMKPVAGVIGYGTITTKLNTIGSIIISQSGTDRDSQSHSRCGTPRREGPGYLGSEISSSLRHKLPIGGEGNQIEKNLSAG